MRQQTIREDLRSEVLRVYKFNQEKDRLWKEEKVRVSSQEAKDSLWQLVKVKDKWRARGKSSRELAAFDAATVDAADCFYKCLWRETHDKILAGSKIEPISEVFYSPQELIDCDYARKKKMVRL